MSASNEDLARQAADPAAGWETLQRIVADHPELRAAVAGNPAAYPELLDWLAELGDPDVDAALAARGHGGAGGVDGAADADAAVDVDAGADADAAAGAGAGDPVEPVDPVDPVDDVAAADARAAEQETAAIDTGAAVAPTFAPSGPASPPTGGPTRLSVRDRMAANDSTWSHAPATRSSWADRAPASAPGTPAAGATGAAALPAEPAVFTGEGSPEERRRAPIALIVLAALVVLGGVFAVWRLLGGSGQEEAAAPTTATATATAPDTAVEPTDEATAESTPTSPADLVRPAPQDAVQAATFSSPSANIVCELAAEGLSCTILEHDFAGPDGCDDGPTAIRLDAQGAVSRACAEGGAAAAPLTLQYGASATFGSGACTSTPEGMSCWDMRTGHGFTVARAGVQED